MARVGVPETVERRRGTYIAISHASFVARTSAMRYHAEPLARVNIGSSGFLPAVTDSNRDSPASVSGTRRGLPFLLSAISSVFECGSKSGPS